MLMASCASSLVFRLRSHTLCLKGIYNEPKRGTFTKKKAKAEEVKLETKVNSKPIKRLRMLIGEG